MEQVYKVSQEEENLFGRAQQLAAAGTSNWRRSDRFTSQNAIVIRQAFARIFNWPSIKMSLIIHSLADHMQYD